MNKQQKLIVLAMVILFIYMMMTPKAHKQLARVVGDSTKEWVLYDPSRSWGKWAKTSGSQVGLAAALGLAIATGAQRRRQNSEREQELEEERRQRQEELEIARERQERQRMAGPELSEEEFREMFRLAQEGRTEMNAGLVEGTMPGLWTDCEVLRELGSCNTTDDDGNAMELVTGDTIERVDGHFRLVDGTCISEGTYDRLTVPSGQTGPRNPATNLPIYCGRAPRNPTEAAPGAQGILEDFMWME